jgi:hypothetical protein
VATVNGEWMNNWFTGDDRQPVFKPTFTTIDDPHTGKSSVRGRVGEPAPEAQAIGDSFLEQWSPRCVVVRTRHGSITHSRVLP